MDTSSSYPQFSPDTLNQLLDTNNSEELKCFLDFASNDVLLNSHLAEILQWSCEKLQFLHNSDKGELLDILVNFLDCLPMHVDTGECLLLFVGQLKQLRKSFSCRYLLKGLSTCIINTGFTKFPRVKHAINEVTAMVSALCESQLNNCQPEELFRLTNMVVNFYQSVLSEYDFTQSDNGINDFIRSHLLFLWAKPFLILPSSKQLLPLMTQVLHILLKWEPSLFRFYNQTVIDQPTNPTFPPSLLVPAWLRLFSFIFLESKAQDLHSCWPLLFTKDYCLDQCYLVFNILFDIESSQKLMEPAGQNNSSCTPISNRFYDVVQLYALDLLKNLFEICHKPLSSKWWSLTRFKYVDLLENVAKRPVSTEEFPPTITRSIELIDYLFKISTLTAQTIIFRRLLERTKSPVHHGWRGHVITVCKDSLHRTLTERVKIGFDALIDQEKNNGEEDPQLLIMEPVFSHLCTLVYMHPSQLKDSIIDQSSWILAALNMALYLFLRLSFERTMETNVLSFIRTSLLCPNSSNWSFMSDFLEPLEKTIQSEIRVSDARICAIESSLQMNCDKKESKRLQSALAAQNSTVLRLRLMESTANRLRQVMTEASISNKE